MKFMNMWKYGARNGYFDKEEGGEQPKGGGGNGPEEEDKKKGEDDKPKGGVYLTNEQFEALISNRSGDDKKKGGSVFDKIDDERKNEDERKRNDSEFKNAVIYNTGVTRYIEEHKQHFSGDVLKAVELITADEKDEIQLEKLLKATIAKDFFRIEDNLNMLPADKRSFVADNIRVPEKYLIDKADQLNDLMGIAMFYAQEKVKREHSNDKTGGGESKSPKAQSYVEKMKRKTKATA